MNYCYEDDDENYYFYSLEQELRELVSINTIIKVELLKTGYKNYWNNYFFGKYDTSLYNVNLNIFRNIGHRSKIGYSFDIHNAIDFFKKENNIIKSSSLENLFSKINLEENSLEITLSYNTCPSIFIGDN